MQQTFVKEWLLTKAVQRHLPLSVQFDLTYRCNEHCVHCCVSDCRSEELPTAAVKDILQQIKTAGGFYISFSGGEPLLRPDLLEILQHATELHFDVGMKSNGTLIDGLVSAKLKDAGVRWAQISIYAATAEIHDSVTNHPGSFARSLAAIGALKECGIAVRLACPLMTINVNEFQKVVDLAAQLEVPYLVDFTISPKIDGSLEPLSVRASAEQLMPILSTSKVCPQGADISQPSAQGSGFADSDLPCTAGHSSCYIAPSGELHPCALLPPLGNLKERSFTSIWNGTPLQCVTRVRRGEVSVCADCALRSYCQRCPGLAYHEDGRFDGPSRRACELAVLRARLSGTEKPLSSYLESIKA